MLVGAAFVALIAIAVVVAVVDANVFLATTYHHAFSVLASFEFEIWVSILQQCFPKSGYVFRLDHSPLDIVGNILIFVCIWGI